MAKKLITRNCFVCNKPMKDSVDYKIKHPIDYPPDDGMRFTTHGNFGSTVFDPVFRPDYLEITVCDKCVKERITRVIKYTRKDDDCEITNIKMLKGIKDIGKPL